MDISVAVATPKGLVTPVVRNVESMDFPRIELAIATLAEKARNGNEISLTYLFCSLSTHFIETSKQRERAYVFISLVMYVA